MKKAIIMNKIPLLFITILLSGILIVQLFSGSDDYTSKPTETNNKEANYAVKSPEIPDNISFAGEIVPIQHFDVKESLDREMITNCYWHSSTIQILKKAKRFFPVIDSILAANNIPDDFKYLCVIESSLNNPTSPAGAKGYWQFMESTGKEYGLEVNAYVDERCHLKKSTQAACEYLKEAKNEFGSWTLAAASYNMGKAGLKRRLNEQNVNNYYDLYLNAETARYVYRIIAMKIIMPEHKKYGFDIKESEKYQALETKTIVIDTTINKLSDFAQKQETNYKILKTLNPWLTNTYLINKSGKKYEIMLPKEGSRP